MSESQRLERDVADLVPRAQAGDGAARDALLARCHPTVYRWALVQTGDPDEAEDVALEVLVRVHHGLERFAGASRFATWLYRITRNVAFELGRRLARTLRLQRALRQRMEDREMWTDPTTELDGGETATLVRALFAELPARQREVFYLADLEELTAVEIAARLGLSPATVRVHLLRARRALRAAVIARHPHLVEGHRR